MIKKIEPVYCIKDYRELWVCDFFKGEIYKILRVNDFTIAIVDENDKILSFNINSPFNEFTIPNYFVSLKEYRKLKLEKLQICSK